MKLKFQLEIQTFNIHTKQLETYLHHTTHNRLFISETLYQQHFYKINI